MKLLLLSLSAVAQAALLAPVAASAAPGAPETVLAVHRPPVAGP